MKNIFFLFSGFLLSFNLFSQDINKLVYDKEYGGNYLVGKVDMEGLEGNLFSDFYFKEYNNYTPRSEAIIKLKILGASAYTYEIVFGSWCPDSQKEVPRMLKVLNSFGLDSDQVKLIAVDLHKEAKGTNVNLLDIQRVPTLIIFAGEVEIGRITESPKKTFEKDILEILSQ